MCSIQFFTSKNRFLQLLFHFFKTNSQIFMSIYLTLFSVGQFSFIEPIIWLLVDCPSNFSEIHIFWEIMEADFVFNGLFFSTSEKNKREKPQVITTDCCLSSSVSSLIFFNQNFETTDWVSQLDPVSSDAINRVRAPPSWYQTIATFYAKIRDGSQIEKW